MAGGWATPAGVGTQLGQEPIPSPEPRTRSVGLSPPGEAQRGGWPTPNGQSGVPMHLRPPSTSKSEKANVPRGPGPLPALRQLGLRYTGYPWAGERLPLTMPPGTTRRPRGNPTRHGPDFGYSATAPYWYGRRALGRWAVVDVNGDGVEDELDRWSGRTASPAGSGPCPSASSPGPTWNTSGARGGGRIGGVAPQVSSPQNGPPEVPDAGSPNQALFNLHMQRASGVRPTPPGPAGDPPMPTATTLGGAGLTGTPMRGRMPTARSGRSDLVKIGRPDRVVASAWRNLRTGGDDPQVRWLEAGEGECGAGLPCRPGRAGKRSLRSGTPGVRRSGAGGTPLHRGEWWRLQVGSPEG